MRSLPTSPDSARRLLSGRRIGFELLTVGSGEAALEQMIQARLAAVGFDVAIRQLEDRKSTRLNSSHITISYAVFCLKKKKKKKHKIYNIKIQNKTCRSRDI